MGLGIHVRIDPDADGRARVHGHGHGVEHLEFGLALDVEAGDAEFECAAHFGAGLADAGEDHGRGRRAGGDHAFEFTARDDVESAAGLGQQLQHGQRGVGLHRIENAGLATGQRALVGRQCIADGRLGVHEQRRAMAPGQVRERDLVDAQLLVAVGDMGRAGYGGQAHGVEVGDEEGSTGCTAVAGAPGRRVWGNVARCAAAGSVGMNRRPFCPQATRTTALAARARTLTRIWRMRNIVEL